MPSPDALFRLDSALTQDPRVAAWFREQNPALGALAERWFNQLRQSGPDVLELMHDGAPTACIADAALGYVNVYTHHVNLGFFRGAFLADPTKLLEGSGKRMRHVKLRPGLAVDAAALEALIAAAYQDLSAQLALA
ncbi:MAG: DUF1801 domain-containing protein [Polyangiaceae bacterium]|nr:DUF1801 domain-containing protein [Myxococcales bacterium]MCB9586182.1 DUF1801 domain-containing protein [Polyangiaceae bacterium]MCB9606859.1 DUF1801 domain-containing protein [Polyangiaceae bacterium]